VKKLLVLLVLATLGVVLVGCTLISAPPQGNNNSKDALAIDSDLIGTWQNTPMVSSGFTDLYHFFGTGRFVFAYSQYDTEKTMIAESGAWSISKDSLVLEIDTMYVLENGEVAMRLYEIAEIREYAITKPVLDSNAANRLVMTIGKEQFWQLSTNPNDYLNSSYKDF